MAGARGKEMAGGQRPLSDNHRTAAAQQHHGVPHPTKCPTIFKLLEQRQLSRIFTRPTAAVRIYLLQKETWNHVSDLFDIIRFAKNSERIKSVE